MKTRLLLLSMLGSIAVAAYAAPPEVSNVSASQRDGTKIVDINYTLTLDSGKTAFVELWFSPDNGLTYPVNCQDVNGTVGAGVSGSGNKTATWNAGSDWDQQFTPSGKIRVIATYGDSPSGFAGTGGGSGGGSGGSSGSHDANMKPVPMTLWQYEEDPGSFTFQWMDRSDNYAFFTGNATAMYIDSTEITNAKWDEIIQWANDNNAGYTGLSLKGGDPDAPVTGISYWHAIKWCNARSQKDGLTPAYYIDASEATYDINGNGVIDTGPDLWEPWNGFGSDPNGNGQWDEGEPYHDDDPSDGGFNPKEYEDRNGNGQYDPGLTQVFKQGSVIADFDYNNMKNDASGYRLPDQEVYNTAVTGGNFKKNWPWGDQSLPGSGDGGTEYDRALFDQQVLTTFPGDPNPASGPTKASDRNPNGFDLYDILGNVAEWTENIMSSSGGAPGDPETVTATVYGGSYLGLDSVGDPEFSSSDSGGGAPGGALNRFSDVSLNGPPEKTSNAIGFRCVIFIK